MAKLAACLLNISEGRQAALIEQIARSALQRVAPDPESNFQSDCAVLNIFADRIYNRSVISIAGLYILAIQRHHINLLYLFKERLKA